MNDPSDNSTDDGQSSRSLRSRLHRLTLPKEPDQVPPLDERSSGFRCKQKRNLRDVNVILLHDLTSIGVDVGTPSQRFNVSKALLCHYSPFFRAALNGPWKESVEGVVPLPEDLPEAFNMYRTWLYINEIELPGSIKDLKTCLEWEGLKVSEAEADAVFMALAQAYVLGDKLQDILFKNAVVDAIIDYERVVMQYPNTLAAYVWANTVQSSPLRRLLVDFYAYAAMEDWLAREPATTSSRDGIDIIHGPREFLIDLLRSFREVRDATRNAAQTPQGYLDEPWALGRSRYYEHSTSDEQAWAD